jgi:hypothetical protein
MQRRFGAKVDVQHSRTPGDRQLFLVIGSQTLNLNGLVISQDGRPVFGGPGWVLAEMPFPGAMALRGVRGVRMVGGVSINPERVEVLRKLMEQSRQL